MPSQSGRAKGFTVVVVVGGTVEVVTGTVVVVATEVVVVVSTAVVTGSTAGDAAHPTSVRAKTAIPARIRLDVRSTLRLR